MAEVTIPDFDFTAFYYPEILEALIQFKRINVPELTNESPQEPLIQLLRAFALVGHLNNVHADLVANECTLPTARLTETVRNMLRLIDFEMRSAQPAQVDLIYELAQILSSPQEVVSEDAQAATRSAEGEPARFFEAQEALTVSATNALSAAFGVEDGTETDVTAEANDGTAGQDFSPWTTPVGGTGTDIDISEPGREGDSLMFCHNEVMFDEAEFTILNPASGITGVFEYYDGDFLKAEPDSVTNNGTTLTLDLSTYLGDTNLRGTPIRVQLDSSGAFEDLFSDWDGSKNFVKTNSLLGQSSPSTNPDDYTVGSAWERFKTIDDATADLTASDVVAFSLPQTLTENWSLGTFFNIEGFWFRYRIISVSAPTSPDIDLIRIDTGKQYAKRLAIQGKTQAETLGSSDGTPNQEFETSQENFIDGSAVVTVDGIEWKRVDNFLASKPTDRHYRVLLGENDVAQIRFGDGEAGAIPSIGVNNIAITYRFGAQDDGNVGAQTVSRDRSGLIFVNKIFNPRPATGWEAAQGSDEASLERAKIEGPASLRTRDVALGPDDAENLVTRASSIDAEAENPLGVVKVSRAKAIEEGFGPKTIELVVVAAGGELLTQQQLDNISEFFNGNQFVSPVRPKRMVANQEVTAVNYVRNVIDISATVKAAGAVTAVGIKNALIQLLQPEARQEDGVLFEWGFGETIPTDRIIHEIFAVDDTIKDVNDLLINGVAPADVVLLGRELPFAGTITITVEAA